MGRSHFTLATSNGWSARFLAFLLAIALVSGLVTSVVRAEDGGSAITLGESLSEDQRQELLAYFEADENDTIQVVTLEETRESMSGIIDPDAANTRITSAYSSTALTCRDLGEGLDITTRNITLITPSIYAIALVTAGIGDARLVVAAPNDAPAQGTAALTGVFKTWKTAPCASGETSPERQQMSIRQVSLAAEIGTSLYESGINNGMSYAGDILLYTQQAVVTQSLSNRGEVQDALAEQEMTLGIQLNEQLRKKVVDFMVDLIALDIDWGTYAYGWEISGADDNNGITMRGDGIAIRNAQATATANAEASASAEAAASATQAANAAATQEAIATQTAVAAQAAEIAAAQAAQAERAATETAIAAEAQASEEAARVAQAAATEQARISDQSAEEAEARATEEAIALETQKAGASATEQARQEATVAAEAMMTQQASAPTPTATPVPALAIVGGRIDSIGPDTITISAGTDGALQTFTIATGALILRDGAYAELVGLKAGDFVTLGVDPDLKTVRSIEARGHTATLMEELSQPYLLVLPIILIVILLLVRRRQSLEEPFVVAQVRTA